MGWFLGGAGGLVAWFALVFGACMLWAGFAVAAILGGVVTIVALALPALRRVRLVDGVLEYGLRWRPERIRLVSVSVIEVGKVEHLGLRGGPASGMVVVDADANRHVVAESGYCSIRRSSGLARTEIDAASPGEVRVVVRPSVVIAGSSH